MKSPTYYPEAEQAVLGSMMIESWATLRGLQLLKSTDFHDPGARAVFEAIETIAAQPDFAADPVTVMSELDKAGILAKVGRSFVTDCVNHVATTANIESYVRYVKDASLQRQIDRQLDITSFERSSENVKDLGDLIVALQGNRGGKIFDMRTDLGPMLDELLEKPEAGIKTGIGALDKYINLHPGELWTIGARPGGGKTALMLRLAGELANQNIETLYITMEMRNKELVQRLMPMATNIPHRNFRTATFTDAQIRVLLDIAGDMSTLPLKMAYRSFPTIEDIRGTIFEAKPKVVFIDYLQRCQLPRAENMAYQIQSFYVQLKNFLVDTGVIGFIGCQSDRDLDKNPLVAPTMSHLKGSGAIESESDGVMMMWEPPPEVIAKRTDWVAASPGCDPIEVMFRKNRNGAKNVSADLELNGSLIKMCERQIVREDLYD